MTVSLPDLVGWLHPALYVADSPIQGRGVFTQTEIEASDLVIRWGGWLFPGTSAQAAPELQEHTAVGISDQVVLGAVGLSSVSADDFMNHSCQPNVGLIDAISLVAIRDIPAGDEVLADYAMWTSDETYVMDRGCNCGATLCRSVITGRDWRRPDLQERYGSFFSPFLRRRIVGSTIT